MVPTATAVTTVPTTSRACCGTRTARRHVVNRIVASPAISAGHDSLARAKAANTVVITIAGTEPSMSSSPRLTLSNWLGSVSTADSGLAGIISGTTSTTAGDGIGMGTVSGAEGSDPYPSSVLLTRSSPEAANPAKAA